MRRRDEVPILDTFLAMDNLKALEWGEDGRGWQRVSRMKTEVIDQGFRTGSFSRCCSYEEREGEGGSETAVFILACIKRSEKSP